MKAYRIKELAGGERVKPSDGKCNISGCRGVQVVAVGVGQYETVRCTMAHEPTEPA